MERLTKRTDNGIPWYNHQPEKSVSNENLLRRLAAYEDTGLEPEQVTELKGFIQGGVHKVDDGWAHVQELLQAEQEGRLVVLPCKVGDAVWTNFAMSGWYFRDKDKPYLAKVVFVGLNGSEDMGGGLFNVVYGKHDHMMQFRFSDLGKTVFLTREEADKALRGGTHGD